MPQRTYTFRADGADAVVRAYKAIAAAKKEAAAAGGNVGGAGRIPSAGGAAGGSYQRSASAPRGQSPEVIAAKEAARTKARLAKEEERAIAQRLSYERRQRQQHFVAQTREAERLEKTKTKVAAREANNRARDAQRLNQQMAAIEQRDMAEHMRHREKQAARWRQRAASAGGAISGAAWGLAGGVASAGIAAGSAFASVAGASLRERLAAKDQAIALSNAGRASGQAGVGGDALLADATRVALQVKGTKTADVLTAQQKYVQMTGDLAGARSNAKTFAITARATGASEEDIAATAATMREKFGITDPTEVRNALGTMVGQGKSGAFELRDASQYFTELGAAGARFGLDKGKEGVATLGGLAQIAMKSAGNGAKASTGAQAMLRQLVAKGGAGKESIKALTGADVFTDSTHSKTRDVKDVLVDVIGGAKGDQTKLQKIFGDEGMVGASALVTAYNSASNANGGDAAAKRAAGEEAVRKMLDETINAAGDWKDVLTDYAAATDTAGATLTQAWEKMSSEVGDALAPAFTKVVTAIAPLAGQLKPFAEGLAIATDRVVGLAKKMGWLDEEAPEEQTTVPKAELYNTNAELKTLEAKEKQLGGLTPADQNKKAELQAKVLSLKDRLLSEDPSLTLPGGAGVAYDPLNPNADPVAAGSEFQFGKGALRPPDTRSALDRILSGEDIESRDEQKAWYGRGPKHATTMRDEYNNADMFGKATIAGGWMLDNVLNGDSPFKSPDAGNADARNGYMSDLRSQAVSSGAMGPMQAAAADQSQLIAALNDAAAAFRSTGFSTQVK